MFLKLISQRKAWSLQKCWVPYKHWGNVYIICAKKIAQIKPGVCRVQTPRNYWETIYIFWYYFIPRNMLYNSAGGALSNAIQEVPVHLRGFSHQQLNNKLMIHILQLLLVQTLNKSVQKRFFCWVSNFEHFEAIIHLVILFFYLTPYHAVDKWSWFTKLTTSETTCIICHCVCLDWTMLYQIFVPYEPAARSSNNLS